jgi:Uma2 family endonuclease
MAEPHVLVPGNMTVDDYLAMPDDGKRYELLDGSLEEMTGPNLKHQRVLLRLAVLLVRELQDAGVGEVLTAPFDVVLGERTVLQPDVLFIRCENTGVLNDRNARGAPDVVVEVLSDSTRRKDVVRKTRLYARAGVPWYWVVDPDVDRIEFLRRDGEGYALVGRADAPGVAEPPDFPGVRIDLAALFG